MNLLQDLKNLDATPPSATLADGKSPFDKLKQLFMPFVGRDDMVRAIGYVTNAGTPLASLTPQFTGQWCLDTTNNVWYRAKDLANTDWVMLGIFGVTQAELAVLDGVTAGTVTASKALVVDANKDLTQLRNLRVVRTLRGEGAAFSDATAGNITYTAAQILGGTIVRDPNGGSRTDVLPTAQLLVAALPGAAVGDIIECLIVNGADAAETITLTAGAGGAYDANQTAASRITGQNASKKLTIRLTNVTPASEAYVVYY